MTSRRPKLYLRITQRFVNKGERYLVLDTSRDCYLVETIGHPQWMLKDYFTAKKPEVMA